jgi:valyl-tRNA synthetase
MNVNPGAKTALIIAEIDEAGQGRLDRNALLIQRLARVEVIDHTQVGKGAVTLSVPGAVMALPLAGIVDVDAENARLSKAMAKVAKEVGGLKGKLGNERFLANAKPEVVEEQRGRLVTAEAEVEKLEAALQRLADLG